MSRSRTYIFTIENFTETDWEYVCNLEKDGKKKDSYQHWVVK